MIGRNGHLEQISETEYKSSDGFTMAREEGITPNGNLIAGRWVLRKPGGEWIDVDQYRLDLASRHGFTIGMGR